MFQHRQYHQHLTRHPGRRARQGSRERSRHGPAISVAISACPNSYSWTSTLGLLTYVSLRHHGSFNGFNNLFVVRMNSAALVFHSRDNLLACETIVDFCSIVFIHLLSVLESSCCAIVLLSFYTIPPRLYCTTHTSSVAIPSRIL